MMHSSSSLEISVEQLKAFQEKEFPHLLLDVREPSEIEIVRFEDALLIPLQELTARAHEIPLDKFIVVVCHHGQRSLKACIFLKKMGFENIASLKGGIDEWARRIDSSMPVY